MVIKDQDFEKIADSVKPDVKRRVVLHNVQIPEGVTYHIYKIAFGQIVLDPQVTIPASEIWLFNNPKALASVRRGPFGCCTRQGIQDLISIPCKVKRSCLNYNGQRRQGKPIRVCLRNDAGPK